MWRNEGNGHKYITNRWWQGLRDYLLWGFPVVCAFLNMKLSNVNDKRAIWKFKHSLVSYTQQNAPSSGLRKRSKRSIENFAPDTRNRRGPPYTNPYKCVLGKKSSRKNRLKAAKYCERSMGRRMGAIADYFNKKGKKLRCARCGDRTAWCCLSCGVALCLTTVTSAANHNPVCCMDICHLRWKYDLETGRVLR